MSLMAAPTVDDIVEYLPEDSSDADEVLSAFAAEKAAQAHVCLVPADDAAWPADLVAALGRRVATHLYARNQPSGFESSLTEFGVTSNRVGGRDYEVERLEAPYRVIAIA